VSNIRHVELLGRSAEALARAEMLVANGSGQIPEELLLADLALAREALEEVTGKRNSDELLEAIFSKFCIGK
jgi:tRNA U34 5-carboxymethylaminomethyl modifying GTPase MnmE/TrmE